MGRLGHALALAGTALLTAAGPASAYEVDSASDASLGACSFATAGDCSLRDAITLANSDPGPDVITFEIPGAGDQVISLTSDLPPLNEQTRVFGSTQGDAVMNNQFMPDHAFSVAPDAGQGSNARIRLEIDGQGHDVFDVRGDGTLIQGLAVHDAKNDGIHIAADDVHVAGNFIGLTAAGTAPAADSTPPFDENTNPRAGIYIESGADNVIGNGGAQNVNVISGNVSGTGAGGTGIQVAGGSNTRIEGNLIGTNPAGTAAIPSGRAILVHGDATGVSVGNDFDAAGNLISGHNVGGSAVDFVAGNDHILYRNRIGTDITGTSAIPNLAIAAVGASTNGVRIGNGAGDGNLISGNGSSGIDLDGAHHFVEGNRIGTNAAGTAALANDAIGIIAEGDSVQIGGPGASRRNLISGNGGAGIFSGFNQGPTNSFIDGNYIGTNAAGNAAIPNGNTGITLSGAESTRVGGVGNLISGNDGGGVVLREPEGTENDDNLVVANKIGTAADGTSPLPNDGPGVRVHHGFGNEIGHPGSPNVIAHNTGAGVLVTGDEEGSGDGALRNDGNPIRGNSIYANGLLGIDLVADRGDFSLLGDGPTANDLGDADDGNNERQNFPVVNAVQPGTSTTFVRGFINSRPGAAYTIDLYRTPACDVQGNASAHDWIDQASATTNEFGNALWNVTVPATVPAGEFVVATATDATGNTSELGVCRESGTAVADPALVPPPEEKQQSPGNPQQPRPQPQQPQPEQRPACLDRTAPITTLKRSGVDVDGRTATVTLKGRSRDARGCPSGVRNVEVSLARVRGRTGVNCRFVKKRDRYALTGRKNCRRPTLFRAEGTSRWTFTFRVKLPPGLYRAQARATDQARNKETPKKRRNIAVFAVRR